MNPYAIPPLITCIILTSIGIFVFLKNRTSKLNILFSFLTLSMAVWLFGYTKMYLNKDPSLALQWARIGFLGIIFIPVFAYHFIISFLNLKRKIILPIIYLLAIPSLLFSQTNLIYNGIKEHFWGYYPTAGKIYIAFLLMFYTLLTRGALLLYFHLKKESGIKREQMRYMFLAFGLGTFGVVDYLIKYPLFDIYPFGYICALAFNGLIAFAIVRYRLLDINIALTRAGIFIIVYTLVLGIPFWLGYKYNLWKFSTWAMLVLATAGPFLYSYLRRQAEDLLLKDQRRYQKALIELSKTMARIRDLDKLYRTIVLTVVEKVKVSFAAIYLKDEEYNSYHLKHCFPKKEQARFQECIPLDYPLAKLLIQQRRPLLAEEVGHPTEISLDSGLVIPCFIEDSLLGFLVIGAKPNSRMYTPDDILIFEALSYSTSLAIENCRFWKEIEDKQRKARLQEMDTYSYSLAHEINNPMQTVKGVSIILKEEVLKEMPEGPKRQDLQHSFELVIEAADRVFGMVKAIRDFGAPVTGEAKPVNIEEVVEGFSKLFIPQIKGEGIIFEKFLQLLNHPIYVRGEKPELMQILVIFGDNARHALIDAKEKKITLKAELPNPSRVRFSISDTGYGIRKEKLHNIFAAFVTSKASTEGTGMGLYNAKKIVDRYKGRIWAESEGKGKGATFIVELPIAKDVSEEELRKDEFKKKRLF